MIGGRTSKRTDWRTEGQIGGKEDVLADELGVGIDGGDRTCAIKRNALAL